MAYKERIVKQQERWDTIADEEYNNVSLTPEIQLANPEVPLDVPLAPGTVLRIPIKEVEEVDKSLLPPWKR